MVLMCHVPVGNQTSQGKWSIGMDICATLNISTSNVRELPEAGKYVIVENEKNNHGILGAELYIKKYEINFLLGY